MNIIMGSLQIFEHNLSQNKKEKSIVFWAKRKDSANEDNSINDESFVLLMKNLNIFLDRMNKKKFSKKKKNM